MNSRSLGKLRGEQQKAVDVGCRGRAGAAAGDKPGWELVSQLMAARGVAASQEPNQSQNRRLQVAGKATDHVGVEKRTPGA